MSKSVLIVDDSQIVRKVLLEFLETLADWKIVGEAGDGAEAIQKAIVLRPDLILLDFSMPNVNGMEAASALKKIMPNAYIVLFTMFGEALGSTLSSATGVDLVVSKSEGLAYLVESVQRLMEAGGPTSGGVGVARQEPNPTKQS